MPFFLKGDTLKECPRRANTSGHAETKYPGEAAEDVTMTDRKREFVKIMNPREELKRTGRRREENTEREEVRELSGWSVSWRCLLRLEDCLDKATRETTERTNGKEMKRG